MSRWYEYRDPSTEPWWVDALLAVLGVAVLIGVLLVS